MTINISGTCYLANKTTHLNAFVKLLPQGQIQLSYSDMGNDIDITFEISEVQIATKLGNTPREIKFPDGQLFTFTDTEATSRWLNNFGKLSIANKLEKNKVLIFVSLLLIPALIYGSFRYLIPKVAVEMASWVPNSVISYSSRHTLETLDRLILSPSNLTEKDNIALIDSWQKRINLLSGHQQNYKFLLRYSEQMGANAFALPDGTIVVTDDLVNIMQEHPDALFAIILHEIDHVEHQHSMQYIAETLATSVLINFLFGDVSGIADFFLGTSTTIVNNQFSQKLEWQADEFAITTLKNNNLSPESFAKAMDIFLNQYQESELQQVFSTHPLLKARAENARQASNQP